MSWRFAAARLALPEKEHKSMIEFLNTAITRGPGRLRTRPASPSTVWLKETLSTPCVELVTALPARQGSDCYEKLRFGPPAMPRWRRPPWLPAPLAWARVLARITDVASRDLLNFLPATGRTYLLSSTTSVESPGSAVADCAELGINGLTGWDHACLEM